MSHFPNITVTIESPYIDPSTIVFSIASDHSSCSMFFLTQFNAIHPELKRYPHRLKHLTDEHTITIPLDHSQQQTLTQHASFFEHLTQHIQPTLPLPESLQQLFFELLFNHC